MSVEANLAAALALAEAGIRIFPAGLNRVPIYGGWQTIATADEATIRGWWRNAPHALPALACGANGLVVIDCDRHPGAPDGVAAFRQLVATHGPLPPGVPVVRTPRAGAHLFFRQPGGDPLGNGSGRLPVGIDVRGCGGYVLAVGATLPGGTGWRAVSGYPALPESFRHSTVPPLLPWLVDLIRADTNGSAVAAPVALIVTVAGAVRGRAYAEAALSSCEDELAHTAAGQRNEQLYKKSFRLGTMAARGWLTDAAIAAALRRACETNGYLREHGRKSMLKTIESGLRDGREAPHPDLDGPAAAFVAPEQGAAVADEPAVAAGSPTADVGVDDAELARLARLAAIAYERERKAAAERLGVRTAVLDQLVESERRKLGLESDGTGGQGRAIALSEPAPWPEPVSGDEVLADMAREVGRYVAMPEHARHAATLWAAHTHLLDCFHISPRLAIRSPVKGCGKTTLMDVLGCLVVRPLPTANVTPAVVFRVIEACRPTLLVDEADSFLRDNDELRGVLNSGHRRGGSVLRTVGDDHEPRSFATFAPLAIALIGQLPDTLADRAVTVALKRRLPSESVESFRLDRAGPLAVLARKLARWALDSAGQVAATDPRMPAGIFNRAADNWRPLLAIAEAAGGDWPERARKAAEASRAAAEDDDESRTERLLTDVRTVFGSAEQMTSADLAAALVDLEGRPWAEYGRTGKPLSANQLARMLKPLCVAPQVRIGAGTARGYLRGWFAEAFERYLPPEGGSQPSQRNKCDEQRTSEGFATVTPDTDVTVAKCEKSNNDGLCYVVTVAKGESGEREDSESVDLPSDTPVGGPVPGLPQRAVDELARWARTRPVDMDPAEVAEGLRQALAEQVPAGQVETELARVLAAVARG